MLCTILATELDKCEDADSKVEGYELHCIGLFIFLIFPKVKSPFKRTRCPIVCNKYLLQDMQF